MAKVSKGLQRHLLIYYSDMHKRISLLAALASPTVTDDNVDVDNDAESRPFTQSAPSTIVHLVVNGEMGQLCWEEAKEIHLFFLLRFSRNAFGKMTVTPCRKNLPHNERQRENDSFSTAAKKCLSILGSVGSKRREREILFFFFFLKGLVVSTARLLAPITSPIKC